MRESADEKTNYSPEIKDRALCLLLESVKDYPSTWAAVLAIAPKIGSTPKTLRVCPNKQNLIKVQPLSDQERIQQLERENKK